MKWFQHQTNMSETDFGSYIRSVHGLAGYARWCILLEKVAAPLEKDYRDKPVRELPIKEWAKYLEIRQGKLVSFLKDLINLGGIKVTEVQMKPGNSEKLLRIEIPQLKDWCDNHTKNESSKNNNLQVNNKQELKLKSELKLNSDLELNAQEREQEFVKPTLLELSQFIEENGYSVDPERFFDYYESVGWVVGRGTIMKDWKAKIRNWHNREEDPWT